MVEIVTYAKLRGIVPNITTNGSLITSEIASELSGDIGQIQLSVNGHNRELHETAQTLEKFNQICSSSFWKKLEQKGYGGFSP